MKKPIVNPATFDATKEHEAIEEADLYTKNTEKAEETAGIEMKETISVQKKNL